MFMTDFARFSAAPDPAPNTPLLVNGLSSADGADYDLNDDIRAAVDVALGLGRPLLVIGEPGVGKTSLGYAIARRLALDRCYLFVTKSTSEARDLFYRYDALRRFRDAQTARPGDEPTDEGDYLAYQALGAAILDAHAPADIAHLRIGRSHGWAPPAIAVKSLVVIDEIDKASRGFANDILVEIEKLQFDVPELTAGQGGARVVPRTPEISGARKPIVVITSNAERPLPDAFLRRCVFLEVTFPDSDRLMRILHLVLSRRLGATWGDGGGSATVAELVAKVEAFRKLPDIAKKPGLAEVINAAIVLTTPRNPTDTRDGWSMAIFALAKLRDDRNRLGQFLGVKG